MQLTAAEPPDTSGAAPRRAGGETAAVRCALCSLPARGLGAFCLGCGHGGHQDCMAEWFAEQGACPAGCGCMCSQVRP